MHPPSGCALADIEQARQIAVTHQRPQCAGTMCRDDVREQGRARAESPWEEAR
jgi:hypothetical protein